MPAYIVVQVNVKDPRNYVEYGTAWNVQSFMEDYGGEFIMMSNGPEAEVLEGTWNSRLVVMKFPDAEKARAWYDSPEYRDVRTIRWATATTNMVLIPGFDAAALTAPAVAGD
jgi:uncharacterized protein (DUF1330 family)